jgi:hypothetical protein
MRTLSYKVIIFYSALFSTLTSFSMQETPYAIAMQHPDIGPLLCKQLSHEDQKDCRLVCKAWARKNKDWNFMPNNVLQQTNICIEKWGIVDKKQKTIILAKCIAANDENAVRWILRTTTVPTVVYPYPTNEPEKSINTLMLAKSNNNQEMARLLIECQYTLSPNENWKKYYEKLTTPSALQKFYDSHQFDFTFIRYISAILVDDHQSLKQLLSHKITTVGLDMLIDVCCQLNSIHCFDYFLNHEKAHKLIIKNKLSRIDSAQNSKSYAVLKALKTLPQQNTVTFTDNTQKKHADKDCIIQ